MDGDATASGTHERVMICSLIFTWSSSASMYSTCTCRRSCDGSDFTGVNFLTVKATVYLLTHSSGL